MCLNDGGLGSLTENLQEVIIADKIKSRETGSLLFQEIVQALLTAFQTIQHGGQNRFDRADPEQRYDSIVALGVFHDHSEIVVDFSEYFTIVKALKILFYETSK